MKYYSYFSTLIALAALLLPLVLAHDHAHDSDHSHDHGGEPEPKSMDNVGLAFLLTVIAGGCTSIGASAVFCKPIVKMASSRVLSAGLSFSGGIMIYVSFVEVYSASKTNYACAGHSHGMANLYGTLTFFAGCALMAILDFIVHKLEGEDGGLEMEFEEAVEMANKDEPPVGGQAVNPEGGEATELKAQEDPGVSPKDIKINTQVSSSTLGNKKLKKMGLTTALAIALHNLPEGLATFVSTLDNPYVGATMAFGIALHNIPEGLCVAVPVYYATGNRCKGFLWGMISGLSEPIGALIAWGVLAGNSADPLANGITFGMVGGMMVMIVVHELMPTAHRYDRRDTVCTKAFVLGMLIMALSVVFFEFSGGHSHGCAGDDHHDLHGGHHRRF